MGVYGNDVRGSGDMNHFNVVVRSYDTDVIEFAQRRNDSLYLSILL